MGIRVKAKELPLPEHFNALLVSTLPKQRRSRHPYQLCVMFMLLTISIKQLIVGFNPMSSVNLVDMDVQILLNWFCVTGASLGILAAFIPERVVYWGLGQFDATYLRIFDELASQFLLFAVWLSYFVAIVFLAPIPFWEGYSLGSGCRLAGRCRWLESNRAHINPEAFWLVQL